MRVPFTSIAKAICDSSIARKSITSAVRDKVSQAVILMFDERP
jgi:hypothetical protein